MDWAVIQEAIRQAVATALELPDVGPYQPVVWENTSAGGTWNAPGAPRVRLRLYDPANVGQDAVFWTYDAGADKLLPTVSGSRSAMVSARITAETARPGAEPVGRTAGRLRAGLRWPRVRKILEAAEVSIASIRPTIEATSPLDQRATPTAVVDLVLNLAERATDTYDSGGYFTRVRLGGAPGTDLEDIPETEIGS